MKVIVKALIDVTDYLATVQTASEFKENQIDQRLGIFNKVKELQLKKTPIKRISTILKISRNTVRSYFIQENLAPRIHPKSVNIALFSGHILSRLSMEGYKKKDIFNEILEPSYNGGRKQAFDYINKLSWNMVLQPLITLRFSSK